MINQVFCMARGRKARMDTGLEWESFSLCLIKWHLSGHQAGGLLMPPALAMSWPCQLQRSACLCRERFGLDVSRQWSGARH